MGTKCSATRAVCTILHIPHGRTFTMEVNPLTLTPCLNTNTSGNIGIPTSPHYTTRSRVSTNAAVKPGRNTKSGRIFRTARRTAHPYLTTQRHSGKKKNLYGYAVCWWCGVLVGFVSCVSMSLSVSVPSGNGGQTVDVVMFVCRKENKKTDSKEVQKEEDALFLCRLCLWVCVGFVSCVSILPSTRPPPTRRLRPVSVGRSSTDTRDSAFRQFHTFYLQ